ncbi:MAG: ABC transporter permease [Rectinema sp.]|jgi:ribose transport system permease protein|uniref:Ribose transport system permease protein RbsC n=1 Tax=uncultured spirochete TaxID=156406 RepID=A0A3P3XNW8_9SPIR|nr:Ribose transport system permease protein RbsC [uncultured spirochete]
MKAHQPVEQDSKEKKRFKLKTEGTLVLLLLVLAVFLTIFTRGFLTGNNLSNLVRQTAINGIVALGMTFVVISGGIDLSVGSVVGFAGILVALLMKSGVPIGLAVLASISISFLLGVANGFMVFDGRIPPFIATLGSMSIIRGAIMLISRARMIAGLPKPFLDFAQTTYLGLPALFVVWLVLILFTIFLTKKTPFGRNVYTIGSNLEVARLSGINIRFTTYMIYGLSGLMAGIAGILMTSRLANGIPTGGQGYEMDAIASCVIGGASLSGAEGTILGTVLGAVIIATLRNGGNLLGIDPFILQIVNGVIIVAAVYIDQYRKAHQK